MTVPVRLSCERGDYLFWSSRRGSINSTTHERLQRGGGGRDIGRECRTVRRWIDNGSLDASRTENGRRRIDGVALAQFAQSLHEGSDPLMATTESIRNHFTGIVTKVVKDKVMAQVELQAGPFRVVALISREAVDDMGSCLASWLRRS